MVKCTFVGQTVFPFRFGVASGMSLKVKKDMKTREKSKLTRKVTVRFKQEEYNKVNASFKRTTKRKLSEYIRYVLLEKPVTVYTRNRSVDDLMAQLILLKNELSAIGSNFNQAVKRLHTMDKNSDLNAWVLLNEKHKENFFKKVDEINQKITQLSGQWLQE
jgi:hypothetical protein